MRSRQVVDGNVFEEDDHGSMILVGDGSAPGRQEILLRGSFALVRYTDRPRSYDETRLVLLGFSPENRKLVYTVREQFNWDATDLFLHLDQDSPGMAREGDGG